MANIERGLNGDGSEAAIIQDGFSLQEMEILSALMLKIERSPQDPGKILMTIQRLKDFRKERYGVLAKFPEGFNISGQSAKNSNSPIYVRFIPETTCGKLAAEDILSGKDTSSLELDSISLTDLIESLEISEDTASYNGENPSNFLLAGMLGILNNEAEVTIVS